MRRRALAIVSALAICIAIAAVVKRLTRPMYTAPIFPEPSSESAAQVRRELFAEVQPVRLANCELARLGEPNDGGYLVCANLLPGAAGGYSYGISGYDQWGCDLSRRLRIPVHQYDCFDPERPACPGGDTQFHDECIASSAFVDQSGRRFNTLEQQLSANGHGTARVLVKMDVEGAEWEAFERAPDAVLERIDQLAVELHGTSDPRFVAVVRRLKRFFHVAHLHFNNFSCWEGVEPFPAWAYELLLVNKRIAQIDPSRKAERPHTLDAANNVRAPDCQ